MKERFVASPLSWSQQVSPMSWLLLDGPCWPNRVPFNMIMADYAVVCTSKEPGPIITLPSNETDVPSSPPFHLPLKEEKKDMKRKDGAEPWPLVTLQELGANGWLHHSFWPFMYSMRLWWCTVAGALATPWNRQSIRANYFCPKGKQVHMMEYVVCFQPVRQ